MPHRWRVLIVVSVAVFLVSLDMFIVNIAFPAIERGLGGADVATASWVLSAYAIVVAALLVPAGRIADRAGRRRVFLWGLVLFTAGSVVCGAAPSIEVLLAARVLQAAGAAFLLPTSLALLLREFPAHERPGAIGAWSAVGGIAAALGPPIGGLLVQASWRLVFYVNVPVALAAMVPAWRLLTESKDASQRRPDLLGAVVMTVSIGLVALGLVQAPAWGWTDARTLACLLAGVLGLAAFWARCNTHPDPVIDPSLLRVRSFAMANASALLFSASFAAMLLGNVLFMTEVWGDSVLIAGLSLAPGPLLAAVLALRAGGLMRRWGPQRLASGGVALFAIGSAWWLWRMGASPNYAGEMLPGLLITGVGVGLTLPSLATAVAASLPPQRFATGSAVFTMSRQIGFVLGISILVAILGVAHRADPMRSFDHGWLFMVIAATAGVGAAAAIGEIDPGRAAEPDAAVAVLAREPLADARSAS